MNKTTNLFLPVLKTLKSKVKIPADLVLGENSLSSLWVDSRLLVASHGGHTQREANSLLFLPIRSLILSCGLHTHDLIT